MISSPGEAGIIWRNMVKDYNQELKKYGESAKGCSTNYLQGWMDSYESRHGPIMKFFFRTDLIKELPQAIAYRKELSNRKELTDKLVDYIF